MGRTVNTNIRYGTIDYTKGTQEFLTDVVKKEPIVIYDDSRNFFQAFEGFYIEEGRPTVTYVVPGGGRGAGPLSTDILTFFWNKSSQYLPDIIINHVLAPILDYAVVSTLLKIIRELKSKFPKKRVRIGFYSGNKNVPYFEFPSNANMDDIEAGIKQIPEVSKRTNVSNYFVKDLKTGEWVEEDVS